MDIEQWINEEYGADAPPPNLMMVHPETYETYRDEIKRIIKETSCAVSLNRELDKDKIFMGRVE